MTLDDFLSRLEGVRRSGDGWAARCPAHDDHNPSLSVNVGDAGHLLVACHANHGCTADAIVAKLGLEMRDLMPENGRRRSPAAQSKTWVIRDTENRIVAEHHRLDLAGGKKEMWWSRDGKPRLRGLKVADLPLYGSELLKAASPAADVYVVEGEKAADALRERGLLALGTVTGAKGTPGPEALSVLRGWNVILWPDYKDDKDVGLKHMQRIAAALVGVAARARFLSWGEQENDDAFDYFARGGTVEGLASLVSEGKPSSEEVKPLIEAGENARPRALCGAELLDSIAVFIRRFVVLSKAQTDVIALWVLHTWAIAAADVTLFLAITSAEMRSGKTRLLEVLELLVRHPWRAITPSEAVLFRKVSAQEPTLLLDETDAIFNPKAKENEGLRALLNAGNRRGATVDRCVPGGKGEIRLETFYVFCPRALAGIGKLPATVADRSLPIRLKRRLRSEQVERFRFRDVDQEAGALRGQVEAWAAVSVEALRQADRPQVPDALDDRQADGAEPLLAIADSAGGEWPTRAREALVELCTGEGMSDDSLSVRLLRDVLTIFEARGVDRLHSADLCNALAEIEEAPWGDYKGKPIKPRSLAWLLELFDIRSSQVKIDGRNRHGYARDSLSDAWSRYVVAPTPSVSAFQTLPTLPPAPALGFVAISETLPPPEGSVLKNGESSITTGTVAEVAFETPPGEPVHENGDDEAALL